MVLDQACGGGFIYNTAKVNQMLGGLILRIRIFDFFVAGAIVFYIHVRRDCTSAGAVDETVWQRQLLQQYVVSDPIMGRKIVIVIECAQLPEIGKVISHEGNEGTKWH